MKSMIWSFDTDGVLNNYPAVWLEFIALQTGKVFNSVDEAKTALGERYELLKHSYRLSDFKYQVPINLEARETINALTRRGDIVYISTSRPLEQYPDMQRRSVEWLKQGGIAFNGFLEKKIEQLRAKKCMIHIDDEMHAIQMLSSQEIQCILYQRKKPFVPASSEIMVVKDLRELLDKSK